MIKINRPELDIKTQISQQSNVDLFSKLEVNFLQKYFKYNLTDYFPDCFANVYEDMLDKKTQHKSEKIISSGMFYVNHNFVVEEIERKIQRFYRSKSKSIDEGDLPFAFKFLYCNRHPIPNLIQKGQLIYIDVKIKADVQKLQDYPQKILRLFDQYRGEKKHRLSTFQKMLSSYPHEYFNIFIIYFGDCNFNYFKKDKYAVEEIKLMGKVHKLRIFVFYVSKQALTQCFRVTNKISNLQYINDLLIQFYELKRQKGRRKKMKEEGMLKKEKKEKQMETIYKIIGVVSLLTAGFILIKIIM